MSTNGPGRTVLRRLGTFSDAARSVAVAVDDAGRTRGSMAMRVARPTRAAMFTSLSIVNLLIRPFTSSLTRDRGTPNRLAASA